MKDYYKTLNLTSTATDEAIKRNYRSLAKMYHPDVNHGNDSAAKRFAEITEAYDVLIDPKKRAEYDGKCRAERAQAQARANAQAAYNRPNASAGANAKYEAQVQKDANAVLNAVASKSYKEGYAAGFKSGDEKAQKLSTAINKLTGEMNELKRREQSYINDRRELESELFDRDREIARKTDQVTELESQLTWLRRLSSLGNTDTTATKQVESAKLRIMTLRDALEKNDGVAATIQDTTSLTWHTRRKELNEQFIKLDKALNMMSAEIKDMNEQMERRRKQYTDEKFLASMAAHAKEWSKKQSSDMKLAKNTLYGTLGVLIWATDEELKAAYEKLVELYSKNTDKHSRDELQKVKQAYNTLQNPASRRDYNTSIGFSEEKIIQEQALAKKNQAAQKEYRDKLADREFWKNFDELSALALAGEPEAQNVLGERDYKGEKIERDFTHAVYWFREAFESKLPAAMYNLGVCYRNGEGVSKNMTIANALFRQASLRGLKIFDTK